VGHHTFVGTVVCSTNIIRSSILVVGSSNRRKNFLGYGSDSYPLWFRVSPLV